MKPQQWRGVDETVSCWNEWGSFVEVFVGGEMTERTLSWRRSAMVEWVIKVGRWWYCREWDGTLWFLVVQIFFHLNLNRSHRRCVPLTERNQKAFPFFLLTMESIIYRVSNKIKSAFVFCFFTKKNLIIQSEKNLN